MNGAMQRDTRQRRAIQAVLDRATRPLGVEDILAQARAQVPGLGQATVYRALGAMQREGAIVPVSIPGRPPRYERAGLKHHHHFACTGCGGIFELPGCGYSDGRSIPPGFRVQGHEVIIYGHCRDCAVE